MEEKDKTESAGDKVTELAGQAADRVVAAAKSAVDQVADKAAVAAGDAARGISDGVTKAALGVVGKAQDGLEKRLEESAKAAASQKKASAQEKKSSKKGGARKRKSAKAHPAAKIAIVTGVIAVVLIAASFALLGPGQSSFLDKEDYVTSAQLEKAVDIDELSTAEFVYNGIAEKYKESGEVDFRISYDAKVKAGIKMSDVTFEVNDEAKVVRPHLPAVEITSIEVDTNQLGYMPENPDGNLKEILEICEQDIANEAADAKDFKTTAEENLMTVIEALTTPILKSKGYTLEWPMSEQM